MEVLVSFRGLSFAQQYDDNIDDEYNPTSLSLVSRRTHRLRHLGYMTRRGGDLFGLTETIRKFLECLYVLIVRIREQSDIEQTEILNEGIPASFTLNNMKINFWVFDIFLNMSVDFLEKNVSLIFTLSNEGRLQIIKNSVVGDLTAECKRIVRALETGINGYYLTEYIGIQIMGHNLNYMDETGETEKTEETEETEETTPPLESSSS